MLHRSFVLPLTLTLAATLLTACGQESTTDSSTTTARTTTLASAQAGSAAELKVGIFFLEYSLDPKDFFNGWVLVRVGAGETLLRLDDNGDIKPWLAQDFKMLSPTSYELTLREGVRFSDGTELSAEHVQESLERVMAINPRAPQYFSLDHIEVVAPHRLIIHTQRPEPALFANLCEPLFSIVKLPNEAKPQEAVDSAEGADKIWPNTTLSLPITTGPYQVRAFKPNESVEVVRNEHYHEASASDSRYSVIKYFYIPDAQSRVMALQAGELDLIPTVDYATLPLFTDEERYQILSRISPRTNVVYLNHHNELLSLYSVRHAISLAINREAITKLIGGRAASHLIAPEFVGATASSSPETSAPSHDAKQAAAVELLDEAGIVDSNGNGTRDYEGHELSFKYIIKADHGSADSLLIAQSIQQDLEPLGIGLELQQSENLAAVVAAGDFDFFSANDSTVPTGDPYYFLATRFGTNGDANYGHYHNATVDNLLRAMQNSFERDQRLELSRAILDELTEDEAALFINHIDINEVASAKLQDLHLYSFDYYFIDDQVTSAPAAQ